MKTPRNRPAAELLAPAGSYASLVAAVNAGADAVYMGGQRFGARAFADNPDADGLRKALEYVHLRGRRLFLTVNTLVKDSELADILPFLEPLYREGLDGVIVQDIGVCRLLREHFPDMEIHASTQMTLCGPEGARLVKELGVCRVVPARELSLRELRRLCGESGQEVECFIHGALCYSYSGQCLMSSFQGGRSGNRGRCAQPCRLEYEGGRWLNLKDLCALPLLPQILDSGVYSLKIEGRMKSPEYTAGVVRIYRRYLDRLLEDPAFRARFAVDPGDLKELSLLFDRGGFTDGYFRRKGGADMLLPGAREEAYVRAGEELLSELRDRFGEEQPLALTGRLRARAGEPLALTLLCGAGAERVERTVEGTPVQEAQNRPMTEEEFLRPLRKTGGSGFFWEDLRAQTEGSVFAPVSALNDLRRRGLESIRDALLEGWRRDAVPAGPEAGTEPALKTVVTAARDRADTAESSARDHADTAKAAAPWLTVSLEDPQQLETVLRYESVRTVYLPADTLPVEELAEAVSRVHAAGKRACYAFPYIFREDARRAFTDGRELLKRSGADGWLLRSLDELGFAREQALPGEWITDGTVYAWNREAARQLREWGADVLTASFELHEKDIRAVLPASARWEMLLYGRVPLMISAQCVQRTREGCLKEKGGSGASARHLVTLTDRTGAADPVQLRCRYCYNTIYNSRPLWLADLPLPVTDRCRLAFTSETAEEMKAVLDRIAPAFADAARTRAGEALTRG